MSQKLRIGYLVPQFPGQTHIFFWREVQVLESMGHEVHLLSTRMPHSGLISHDWSQDAIARTTYLGQVEPVAALQALWALLPRGLPRAILREGPGFAKDVAVTLSAARALVTLARERGLDHVHVHSCARAALIAALARQMGGPTYSLTLHGPLSDYGPGQRFKWRHAAFATIITHKLLNEMQEAMPDDLPPRLVVRPMGVDTDELRRDAPYQPPEKGRPLRLFSCGRLNVVKGHQDLMSAMRQLLDQGVDVRLEIAGEDDAGGEGFRKDLEAHLRKLRLQDHVKLLGAIDAGAVKQKLLDAHVFVLASWHEPLGVAYMEAMACGVPVIGTDAGGVRELIDDGHNGKLVPPKDPTALARAIRDLAQNPDSAQRFSDAGRIQVETRFRASLGAETLVSEILATRDNG
ncbi:MULTISPECIES: exopolysaccharide biosynthesis GT4 family glycosyltransferase EpsE [Salipiger]|uniref:exopolysaccharide biosynthesis GT4 family glycosyltransferase EpsE n=1 Tax=Salipiger TaxID=263377 RepID=UPI0008EC4150|nr:MULTISPECIES: exopolysaccharide biosynthesis GT4 family glycosyltransferase EpsE [Salipiger]GGA09712.1 colanic acid biosynthesis glycosyltransferase WcaL [Salipiger profundus]SFC60941.1 Glycosyltransferase involved in cell wall bisynthesis [Salipiger profundus]